MAERESSSLEGTLLVAALLLLLLGFAGAWIVFYVSGSGAPWMLVRWFGIAAVALIAVAFFGGMIRRRRRDFF